MKTTTDKVGRVVIPRPLRDRLDELIVQVGSVTLGRGKPLFPRRVLSPQLRLVSVQQMGSGMVELRYGIQRASDGGGGRRAVRGAG